MYYTGCANQALTTRLEMSKDELDTIHNRMRWQLKTEGRGIFYWGCDKESGFVDFFYWNPHDTAGYGGRIITITLEDGTTQAVKGPWSSSSSVMNRYFPAVIEVVISTDRFSHYGGYFLVEKLAPLIPEYMIVTDLVKILNNEPRHYILKNKRIATAVARPT